MAHKSKYVEVDFGTGTLTREQRLSALEEIGAKSRSMHAETRQKLIDLLEANDAIEILARMGLRFVFTGGGWNTKQHVPAGHQHHLEMLQAFALRKPRKTGATDNRLAIIVENVSELLDKNTETFSLSRTSGSELDDPKRNLGNVQEGLRAETQYVRGDFHSHQLERYLRSIFRHIDREFFRVHGIEATSVLSTLQAMLSLLETKLNTHVTKLRRIMRVRKPQKAIKEFFRGFPGAEQRRAEILQDAATKLVTPERMRFFLFEESDNYAADVFTFTEAEIVALAPEGHGPAMLALVREWSIAFGALEDATIDHLYMANPVWARPFILLEDGRYFWPCPASLHSFGLEMFERAMSTDPSLLEDYEDARAVALEDELGTLVTRAFPAGEILRNLKWVCPVDGQEYENDIVVVIDRVAILIEAKSGKVAPEARRGADLRLLREVEKLMVDPAKQSERLLRLLSEVRGRHTFQTADGERVIESARIDTFIRLNVTFSVIGAVSSRWPELVAAGLISSSFEAVPTMSIADLDTVFEVLREQATIVHYLRRRTSFELNAIYKADEIDLLAFYIETGFNIGEEEFNGLYLNLYGGSDELNSFYRRKSQGEIVAPRVPVRTALFKRLVAGIEERKGEGWLERAYRLLNVAMGDQLTIEGSIKSSISTVKRSSKPIESWPGNLSNGPPQRREAIAFVWYRCPTQQVRNDRLSLHAAQAMEMAGTNDCLVVGFDVERPPQAFSVMGIVEKRANAQLAIYR